jgi:hypothetical protein
MLLICSRLLTGCNMGSNKINERIREKNKPYINIIPHIYNQLLYELIIRLVKYNIKTIWLNY